ncbi:MAG: O-antigen ligase family protein [Syntrophomonas sp.]
MRKVKTNSQWNSAMAFILGLLSTNNIVYLFVVGTTPIMLICVYSVVCLFLILLFQGGRIVNFTKYITLDLKLFFIGIFVSIVSILLFNIGNAYQWLVGIVDLLLYLTIVILVIVVKDYRKSIMRGILIGLIINVLFIAYAYYLYLHGTVFTLSEVFPAVNVKIAYIGNDFRGWGLFKEPGHLMRFIAIFILLLWEELFGSLSVKSISVMAMIAFMVMFSESASILILVFGIFLYIFIAGRTNPGKFLQAVAIIAFAILSLVLLATRISVLQTLLNTFTAGFVDAFVPSGGNSTRFTGIDSVLGIIKEYPLIGCGWNTLTKLFISNDLYNLNNAKGAYSEGLSLIAEVGLWSLFYFGFLIRKTWSFLKNRKDLHTLALGCSLLIYFVLYFTTDFCIDGGSAILLGLVLIKSKENNTQQEMIKQTLKGVKA